MSRRPNKPSTPPQRQSVSNTATTTTKPTSNYIVEQSTASAATPVKPAFKPNTHAEGANIPVNLPPTIPRKYDMTLTNNSNTSTVSIDKITIRHPVDTTIPYGYIPGFNNSSITNAANTTRDAGAHAQLIYNSALQLAYAPGKQLFATGFMLWMSGTSLQVFSIFMLAMAFSQPLTKLMSLNTEFSRFDTAADQSSKVNLLWPKVVYAGGCMAGIAMALWKCNQFGLLPTSVTDFIDMSVKPNNLYAQLA